MKIVVNKEFGVISDSVYKMMISIFSVSHVDLGKSFGPSFIGSIFRHIIYNSISDLCDVP
jgi:hypothetical protein